MDAVLPDSKQHVAEIYRKRAKHYDFSANLYYLIGFRVWAYRKQAVAALDLGRGDTVVEIGCGTGLNFPLLYQHVGPEGKIIGVDLADAMLSQARRRVQSNGWSNVELALADAASFRFPPLVDGVISTFALSLVPELDVVIHNGAQALKPGGRWVVADLKLPSNRLIRLTPLILPIVQPFAVTEELIHRRPWDVIRETFSERLTDMAFAERYMGFAFIASGRR